MRPGSSRGHTLEALASETFDLLVLGGGIAGAAIAREASLRGLSVALVERGDFASGTSGRTSRLVHGGLRYLKLGQFSFVRKSIRAQRELALAAPRLVRPISFLTPLYDDGPYRVGPMRAFMGVFRALHVGLGRLPYENLRARACLAREPLLRKDGLRSGFRYREYTTDDARMVVETVLAASERGAVVLSYAAAKELLRAGGRAVGARVHDRIGGQELDVRARAIVSAVGPWVRPEVRARRLRLSKGVHLVIPRARLPLTAPLVFFSPRDRRAMFALPRERWVLVGTTETEHEGAPDDAAVDVADMTYVLEALQNVVPVGLGPGDVADAFASVRPLLAGRARDPGVLSRDHAILTGDDGVVTVLGGKLTLHRAVAADALAALGVRGAGRGPGADPPLPGEAWSMPRPALESRLAGLVGPESAAHLAATYGGRAANILAMLEADTDAREPLAPGLPHVRAELDHALRAELAVFPEDFARRRTDFAIDARVEGLDSEAALAAAAVGWGAA